ncbi:HNH endonuclease signature motif containing protein [Brevibacillus sp. FSL K6-0770]|uniref:HNH endonuclease signature motif containing protein n=1 Tax=Brevibacillus sp. FSL K6-0770 TaxID=2954673 RepID=UPI0030FC97C9
MQHTQKKSSPATIEEKLSSGTAKIVASTVFTISSDEVNALRSSKTNEQLLTEEELLSKSNEALDAVMNELEENVDKLYNERLEEWMEAIQAGKNPYKGVNKLTDNKLLARKAYGVEVVASLAADEANHELVVITEITDIDGIPPAIVTGTAKLEYADKRTKSFRTEDSSKFTFTAGKNLYEGSKIYSDPVSVDTTHFWRVVGASVGTWSDGVTKSYYDVSQAALLNKKAIVYPAYEDEDSDLVMFEPDRADLPWVPANQREPRDPDVRDNFVDWYENEYGRPSFSWSNVDIHHIIPLAYGGDNGYDNLIPLPKNFHRKEVTPWWASYGKYVPSGDDY